MMSTWPHPWRTVLRVWEGERNWKFAVSSLTTPEPLCTAVGNSRMKCFTHTACTSASRVRVEHTRVLCLCQTQCLCTHLYRVAESLGAVLCNVCLCEAEAKNPSICHWCFSPSNHPHFSKAYTHIERCYIIEKAPVISHVIISTFLSDPNMAYWPPHKTPRHLHYCGYVVSWYRTKQCV